MNWNRFESFIGEEIPRCVKTALEMSGYDTVLSLCEIKQKSISDLEKHINAHGNEQIQKFECNHSDYYKQIQEFRFLPGHEAIILALPKYALEFKKVFKSKVIDIEKGAGFPFILNEMIRTAEVNQSKDKNHATYSETIRYFATYIYLLCGRSCYEMMKANLPIPSTKSIRKFPYIFFVRVLRKVSRNIFSFVFNSALHQRKQKFYH